MGRIRRAAMWISQVGIVTILLCALFASVLPIQAASVWISPTGHNDPDNKWSLEERIYDEGIGEGSRGGTTTVGSYIELTLPTAILCDKVRIYASDYDAPEEPPEFDPNLDVDVYYGDAWHNIKSGSITKLTWVTIEIGSVQSVSKARIKFNSIRSVGYIYEFDFLDSTMAGTPSWTLLVGIASAFGVIVFMGVLVLLGSSLTLASVLIALMTALVGVIGMVVITQIIMGLH